MLMTMIYVKICFEIEINLKRNITETPPDLQKRHKILSKAEYENRNMNMY